MSSTPTPEKQRGILNAIERIGNALPDPATLFIIGVACVFAFSWIASTNEWNSVLLNSQGEEVLAADAINLISADGFRWLIENLIDIFVNFRPLGLVLVAAIGIAVAEKSGLIAAALMATVGGSVAAQQGAIAGRVTNATTLEPVEGKLALKV